MYVIAKRPYTRRQATHRIGGCLCATCISFILANFAILVLLKISIVRPNGARQR